MLWRRSPGIGVVATTLSAANLGFGNVPHGTTSAPQSVTFTNNLATPINVSVAVIANHFSQTNDCPSSLAAGASCTANVTFQPLFGGRRDGALTFTHSAPSSPRYVGLSGVGT